MAAKTVVCPECGSAAAPGRYACADCGAMLAAVGPTSRSLGLWPAGDADIPPDDVDGDGVAEPIRSASAPFVVEAGAEPGVDEDLEPGELNGSLLAGALAFDENAPLAAVRSTIQPDVLHDLPMAMHADDDDERLPSAPAWPPPGDLGPLPAPEPRTPAGAYLPPSAVLPPLDGLVPGSAAAGAAATADPAGSGSTAAAWANRGSAALTGARGSVRVTADASRRAISAGAALGAFGIVLPWVNTLPGASPVANYLDRWGLAAAGMWLVLVGLVALATVAASSGRAAGWPVGLPAIVTAAFLGGLVWPYTVGGSGRSIGIWVVVVGAVVLVVGGLLDRRTRHDRGDAAV
jgi:hypothetical protein